MNNARFYAAGCRTRVGSTWINFMPMFHTTGCAMITLGALSAGCRMVLMALFEPESAVRHIERERVTSVLNIDIDDEACVEVMRRYRLSTKREAVNFALRLVAAEPLGLDEARGLRGSGWDGDLDEMRSGRAG